MAGDQNLAAAPIKDIKKEFQVWISITPYPAASPVAPSLIPVKTNPLAMPYHSGQDVFALSRPLAL